MCGICGFVGRQDDELLRRMTRTLVHRGPDDEGFFSSPEASLGFRRLSIIDLETGNQPLANEEGTVRVVLNGEIYNYRTLREELVSRGHSFASHGDVEVIVHLYEELGEGLLGRLQGMFAFALWDERRKRLLLARDRLGIKPLYYCQQGRELYFASEAKAILANRDFQPRLNRQAAGLLLRYLYLPGANTLIEGIKRLPPGYWLSWQDGQVRLEPYWEVRLEAQRPISEAEAIAGFRKHFEEAVASHLESDVPVGAFLSSGVDSAGVVAQMVRVLDRPPMTFTVGLEGPLDERPIARRTAEHLRTDHHELGVDPGRFAEDLPRMIWHLEEPTPIPFLPLYYLSQFAKKQVKTVLLGEGSDELFAGYQRLLPFAPRFWFVPREVKKRIYLRALHTLESAARGNGEGGTKAVGDPLVPFLRDRAASPLKAILGYEQRYELPDYQLHRVDRMTMAWGLEARVPYLDYRLVEYVNSLPDEMKIRGLRRKYLLRRALAGMVPAEILEEKKKRGFGDPFRQWFSNGLLEVAHRFVNEKVVRERGLLKLEVCRQVFRPRRMPWAQRSAGNQIFLLLMLEIYCRLFLDSTPRESIMAVYG
ncbi:MAG: asparagine synthase (glutamine-hydrolyzing) [Acidobacteria bacterium]|nr:asparagine synthase (glutamine-hydrolyzing) [Acidobacteriota bacterium]